MPKPILKRIEVTDIFPPQRYSALAPGDTVVSMDGGRIWRVIEKSADILTLIPYSGGQPYRINAEESRLVFGKIDLPEELKGRLSLQ